MSAEERRGYLLSFRLAVGLLIESERAKGKRDNLAMTSLLRWLQDGPESIVYVLLKLSLMLHRMLHAKARSTGEPARPPFNAEYLLYLLLRKEEREALIGDLIEEYGTITRRFNKQRADIWFYKQVLGSLLPLLRRQILRIGALVWLGRILRRLIS